MNKLKHPFWKNPTLQYAISMFCTFFVSSMVTILFCISSMYAMALKDVEAELQKRPEQPSLSIAFYKKNQPELLKYDFEESNKEQDILNSKLQEKRNLIKNIKNQQNELMDELKKQFAGDKSCQAELKKIHPEDNNFNVELQHLINHCSHLNESRNSEATQTLDENNASSQSTLAVIRDGLYTRGNRVSDIEKKVAEIEENGIEVNKEIADMEKKIEVGKIYEIEFHQIDVLGNYAGPLFGWITNVPPSLLPFLLSAFSGLFGAVLYNLIIIVYPKNNQTSRNAVKFLQHTFLGGLVAIALFVVISSGTAMLGFAGGAKGTAAYFSFIAIGLFGGMFSREAAGWLEQRRKMFSDNAATDAESTN